MSIWMGVDMNVWAEKIKALPMVTEVVRPAYWPLLGEGAYSSYQIDGYTGMEGRLEQPLTFDEVLAGEEFSASTTCSCWPVNGYRPSRSTGR